MAVNESLMAVSDFSTVPSALATKTQTASITRLALSAALATALLAVRLATPTQREPDATEAASKARVLDVELRRANERSLR